MRHLLWLALVLLTLTAPAYADTVIINQPTPTINIMPGHNSHDDKDVTISRSDRHKIQHFLEKKFDSHCYNDDKLHKDGYCHSSTPKDDQAINIPYDEGVATPLPQDLLTKIAPAPNGYEYMRINDTVVLLDKSSRTVRDSVSR